MNTETATSEDEAMDPEIVQEERSLARPAIPVSVDDLAMLPEEGGVIAVQNRHKIVEMLRKMSIAETSPSDWLLFKTKDGVVTAFLQDSGCKRIWQLWGIEITPIGDFETVSLATDENGDYAIQCKADGFCNVTNKFIRGVLGVRYSDEDFCKDLPALRKKVRVQQASIANRDGNIIRALTGLKNVAIEEIESVYKSQGTGKNMANAAHGKGFGTQSARTGDEPKDIEFPICETCGKKMKWVKGGTTGSGTSYGAFFVCPDRKKVDGKWNDHSSINEDAYRKELAK